MKIEEAIVFVLASSGMVPFEDGRGQGLSVGCHCVLQHARTGPMNGPVQANNVKYARMGPEDGPVRALLSGDTGSEVPSFCKIDSFDAVL